MWNSLLVSALYGVLGILLSAFGYKLFDLIETKVDFAEEIRKGNMAAAVVVAASWSGSATSSAGPSAVETAAHPGTMIPTEPTEWGRRPTIHPEGMAPAAQSRSAGSFGSVCYDQFDDGKS